MNATYCGQHGTLAAAFPSERILSSLERYDSYVLLATPTIASGVFFLAFWITRPAPFLWRTSTRQRAVRAMLFAVDACLVISSTILAYRFAEIVQCMQWLPDDASRDAIRFGAFILGGLFLVLIGAAAWSCSMPSPLMITPALTLCAGGVVALDVLVRNGGCVECAAPLPPLQVHLAAASVATLLLWSPLPPLSRDRSAALRTRGIRVPPHMHESAHANTGLFVPAFRQVAFETQDGVDMTRVA